MKGGYTPAVPPGRQYFYGTAPVTFKTITFDMYAVYLNVGFGYAF